MIVLVIDVSVIRSAYDDSKICQSCLQEILNHSDLKVAMTTDLFDIWDTTIRQTPRTDIQKQGQSYLSVWRTSMLSKRKIVCVIDVPQNQELRNETRALINHPIDDLIRLIELAIYQDRIIIFNASRSYDCDVLSQSRVLDYSIRWITTSQDSVQWLNSGCQLPDPIPNT
jgi:hypothetical protein